MATDTLLRTLPQYGVEHVVYAADALDAAGLDALPFGMIQLDPEGTVLRYSSAEARLSGLSAGDTLGRNFFREVAPCTQVAAFYGRFAAGVAAGELDATFDFRFAFRPPRDVRVQMFYSRGSGSVWVKVVEVGRSA